MVNKVKDNQQLEKFIKLYAEDVRNIARKFYISDGSIDDLYQEGLIGLAQGFETYDKSHGEVGGPAFKSFILMCAKRQIIDAVKKSNSKRNLPMTNFVSLSADDFVETPGLSHSLEETFEEKIINKVSESDNAEIVLGLSELEIQVLNLYLEGSKQSEIAKELNKSVKSIDNTLQRIKTKLKRNK